MTPTILPIGPRVSAKAIVIHDGKLLVIKKNHGKGAGDFFILPGGGQNRFEVLFDAVVREVAEETGYNIKAEKILFIRDYIAKNHEFSMGPNDPIHQLEVHILATLTSTTPNQPTELDAYQTGLEWLPLNQIKSAPLFPKLLRSISFLELNGAYLGDVN